MKIKEITFDNFKGLKNQTISFNNNLTVFIGKNGAGKSSILEASSICLSWIIARIKSVKGIGSYIPDDSILNGKDSAVLTASFDTIKSISIPSKTKSGKNKTKTIFLKDLNAYTSSIQDEITHTGYNSSIPVFAYYGVKRAVIVPPLRTRTKDFTQMETYEDSLNGAANFKSFFQWFRNEEDIENEKKRDLLSQQNLFSARNYNTKCFPNLIKKNYSFLDTIEGNYSSAERNLNTIRKALSIFLPEYKNIHIKRRPLEMLIEKNGKKYSISQLSDGEKIYIALIGDLCKRLVLANPTMEDPQQGEGIVLIDEIDLHLHPNWQQRIVSNLTKVFPNIQFIITTHSPHVINSVPTESLRTLNNIDGKITIENSDLGYGLPSLIVLKDIMGLETDLPKEVAEKRTEIYKLLEGQDNALLIETYHELMDLVPKLPELVRLRKLIERKTNQRL